MNRPSLAYATRWVLFYNVGAGNVPYVVIVETEKGLLGCQSNSTLAILTRSFLPPRGSIVGNKNKLQFVGYIHTYVARVGEVEIKLICHAIN